MESIQQSDITKGARKYLIRAIIAPVFMGALYFLAAGNTQNQRAWIYFLLFFCLSVTVNMILYLKNPEMLYHRSNTKSDAEGWDKWLMPLMVLIGFHLQSITMGLETRYLNPTIGNTYFIIGIIGYLISYLITTKAMIINHHFEANVRIQIDREHKVITEGPYSIIRHPGYAAFIIATFSIPIIVNSYFGLVNSVIATILIIIRTNMEDKTLHSELDGYKTYAQKVKWKLFPGIW